MLELYFAPLSCSLATRIAAYEAGLPLTTHEVRLSDKTLVSNRADYLAINPKGQVPALRLESGDILTEGPAVLQYVADLAPASGLAPTAGTLARYRLQQWLNYISTEVHKAVFYALFNPATPPEGKTFARDVLAPARYDHLSAHLADREFLLEGFTVADAYLTTTLNWAAPGGIDLSRWPVLLAYHGRMLQRPAVARAVGEEAALRA